jgi:hypothetical protein
LEQRLKWVGYWKASGTQYTPLRRKSPSNAVGRVVFGALYNASKTFRFPFDISPKYAIIDKSEEGVGTASFLLILLSDQKWQSLASRAFVGQGG